MSGIGTDPEETGDPVQDAWTDAFLDPNADSLDALVAAVEHAVEARTREQVAREVAAADRPYRVATGVVTDWKLADRIARNGPEEQPRA